MKLEELNVFKFLNKRKIPTNKKLKYTIKNHTAYFTLEGYTRFLISHKSVAEGDGYDVRLNGASQEYSDVAITIDDAIKDMIKIVSTWKKEANGNKGTETSPADLIEISKDMFDAPKLKKELSYIKK